MAERTSGEPNQSTQRPITLPSLLNQLINANKLLKLSQRVKTLKRSQRKFSGDIGPWRLGKMAERTPGELNQKYSKTYHSSISLKSAA